MRRRSLVWLPLCGVALLAATLAPAQTKPVPAAPSPTPIPVAVWLRLDPQPAEMPMSPRESFDGVPSRFILMTDGSVYVGGRREYLRGFLDRVEMQDVSTRLDLALKALGKAGAPKSVSLGDGPAVFRLSSVLGVQFHTYVMGGLDGTPAAPTSMLLVDFIRRLAAFRHPSLRPFDPAQFAMIAREKTLPGGCRDRGALPPLATLPADELVVGERLTHGFPTGPEMAQVCEGSKRFTVVFRPLVPGER